MGVWPDEDPRCPAVALRVKARRAAGWRKPQPVMSGLNRADYSHVAISAYLGVVIIAIIIGVTASTDSNSPPNPPGGPTASGMHPRLPGLHVRAARKRERMTLRRIYSRIRQNIHRRRLARRGIG